MTAGDVGDRGDAAADAGAGTAPSSSPAPTRSPADIVDEWQRRAYGDCDLSVIGELIAEPFVRHGITGSAARTHAELEQDVRQYQKALGKPTIVVHDRVVDGDKVWSRTTMRGANLQTGEPRTIDWLQIHRIAEGKIVEVWTLHAADVEWESLR
jgi:ketosteroid isomerase-like protein